MSHETPQTSGKNGNEKAMLMTFSIVDPHVPRRIQQAAPSIAYQYVFYTNCTSGEGATISTQKLKVHMYVILWNNLR
jgi:hypothetical protein